MNAILKQVKTRKESVPQDLSGTTVAIIVGGFGTRLRSVVGETPKGLAIIRGRPFLAYLLDQVMAVGARDVVLCTGYLREQIRSEFGGVYGSLRLTYSEELSPLGTAGALRLALPMLRSNPVLVLNGDSYCDVDLNGLLAWHRLHGSSTTLVLVDVPDTRRYGRVSLNEEGRILGFEEKRGGRHAGWVSAGIYLLGQELLEAIPAGRAVSIEKEVFPAWIGRNLYAYKHDGRFLDIGTPETYALAEQWFGEERYQ